MKHKYPLSYACLCIGLAITSLAHGQQNEVQQSTAEEDDIERIQVSATRRIESLNEVPVSVAAVDAKMLRDTGITDLAELSTYIPNFEVSDASILPNLYVRGIGSGTTHSIEQSVGRFIDDVYIGRAAINLHGMMDVEMVEVLRGPQGTLFGKNTLAGAMIIQTANPTQDFEFGVDLSASRYSSVGGVNTVNTFVSGSLGENLRGRLALQWKDKDGYIDNLLDGPNGGTRDDTGARLKLEWDIGDNTTANLKLEHMEYKEDGQTPSIGISAESGVGSIAELIQMGGRGGATAATFRSVVPDYEFVEDWISYTNCTYEQGENRTTFCPSRDQDSQNITLKVDHEFTDTGTLTSVTGYQKYQYMHRFMAIDNGIIGGGLRAGRDEEYSGISQEFRFTSEEFEEYDYIVGVYFEDSELKRFQPSTFNVPEIVGGGPFFSEIEDWKQNTETLAFFGQFRWHLSDTFSAILGGRWSTEDKDFDLIFAETEFEGNPYSVPIEATIDGTIEDVDFSVLEGVSAFRYLDERKESKLTPSLTLRYKYSNDLMIFASLAQGHKTGGFSDRSSQLFEGSKLGFEAETNTTFELGFKGDFLDGLLNLNVSYFNMSIEDLQVARAIEGNATAFEVKNAAEATSQGLEVDGRILLSESLTLGGNYAYTDATYDDFPGASPSCPAAGGVTQADGLCNYSGLPLIYAPKNKAALYLMYTDFTENDWEINARLGVNYSSEQYFEINYIETLKNKSVSLWDASIRLTSPDGDYSFALVGRNLTEEFHSAWGLQAGFTEYLAPNAPREIAIQFSYKFD